MEVTSKLKVPSRSEWRSWLNENHKTKTEIWLISDDRPEELTIGYLDSVEEAMCFGWIDGIAKRISEFEKAQRFTPRRPHSNWTELNKERARRLIRLGLMTDIGKSTLPDLSKNFEIADDIMSSINADADAKNHFETLPDLYVRVRVGYIEEMRRRPEKFNRRLKNFLRKTAEGKIFGNWNDNGRLQ